MNDKQIKRKEITAYTLMTLLLILSAYILFRMDYARELDKMQAQSRMRLDSIAEMIQFIVENAGMTEPFVRRLADAELEYMKKNGFINNRGEFIPFLKGRNKK